MPKSIMIIGIGRAVAEKFGHEWIVILTGRNTFRLAVQAAELTAQGINAHAVYADATRPAELRKAIAKAEHLTGGLTTVLYNAADVRQQDLFSMADREITEDLAINIAGGPHTIRAAASMFASRGGTILVTGGGLGVTPHPSYASLGVGKAGLRNIVQALAEPLSSQGIRIAIATVATLVAPNSPEARGVAETMWKLANDPQSGWEATYPAPQPSQLIIQELSAMSDQLTLIAKLTARPETSAALGAGLRALVAPTRAEPGCVEYLLHRDNSDPNVWVLYETWRSRSDLDEHFAQPYIQALMSKFPELLAKEMELTFCTMVSTR